MICIVGFVAILNFLGHLLGGRECQINLARLGLILGVLGGLSWSLGVIVETKFLGKKGNYKFLPEWNWFIIKSNDEEKKPND